MSAAVLAAGGVLWRRACSADDIEVALVHRPRYDDWSLPKGKLDRGEHWVIGAVREVTEETGWRPRVGRSLGEHGYDFDVGGRRTPKTVRWWAMQARDGAFLPNDEVDELSWLPPDEAERKLTWARDAAPLRRLTSNPLPTATVLLVRHGHAGHRSGWPGDDRARPLDGAGHRQARQVADVLPCFGPARVLSADLVRCIDTVAPCAERVGVPVEIEPALDEEAYSAAPDRALRRVREIALEGRPVVLSSQGGVVPALVRTLGEQDGVNVGAGKARKGSVWALSFAAGRLLDAEYFPDLEPPLPALAR